MMDIRLENPFDGRPKAVHHRIIREWLMSIREPELQVDTPGAYPSQAPFKLIREHSKAKDPFMSERFNPVCVGTRTAPCVVVRYVWSD